MVLEPIAKRSNPNCVITFTQQSIANCFVCYCIDVYMSFCTTVCMFVCTDVLVFVGTCSLLRQIRSVCMSSCETLYQFFNVLNECISVLVFSTHLFLYS